MPRISARTVAKMRQYVGESLTDACTISREQETRGSMGERLREYALVAVDVPCRVIMQGAGARGARAVGASEALVERLRLIVAHDVGIQTDDRVAVNGAVYEVAGLEDGLTDSGFVSAEIVRVR